MTIPATSGKPATPGSGATTGEIVGGDPHLRMVRGHPKRFFTSECLSRLYRFPWSVVSLEAKTTNRFGTPKALWEVVATKAQSTRIRFDNSST